MSAIFTLGLLAAVVRISLPYVLAALGGTWSERAGVVNLALEGMLLGGAFAGTVGAFFSGSALVGFATACAAGVAIALLYALLVLRFRADQIVTGVALNLMVDGLTRFALKAVFDSSSNSPRVEAFATSTPLALDPVVLLTVAAVIASHWFLGNSRFGLRVRAAGEHPEAARSLGVSVATVRLWALVLAGLLCGLGGGWLAYQQRKFVSGMSNGSGYIALAALIFGKWRPLGALGGALLFGTARALQIAIAASGGRIPDWLVHMFPYVLTMVALAGLVGRSTPPKALGRPLE
jgi:simple sugar transport system permease protein